MLALRILTDITSALELHASFVYVINEYKMVQMKTSLPQRNINSMDDLSSNSETDSGSESEKYNSSLYLDDSESDMD